MKKEKIIIVGFLLILIFTGFYFFKSQKVSTLITQAKINKTSEEKSVVPVRHIGYWSTSKSEKPEWVEKDPSQKTSAELSLDHKIESFLMKHFYIIKEGSEARKSKQYQSKVSWITNYIANNEIWYKSDYHDDISDSRITIFFNYYNCKKVNPKTKEFVKCFTVNIYNFRNDNWYAISRASNEEAMLWRNNTAYVQLYLDYLGDFTRHSNAWMILLPMPRDSMPIYYIKHEGNKTILEKGPDSDWILTDQKEFEKFLKWTEGYKVKHGETPEP